MRTRNEVEGEVKELAFMVKDFERGKTTDGDKSLATLMVFANAQLEVLLDIRDLLANPPVEITDGGPMKFVPITPHTEEKE